MRSTRRQTVTRPRKPDTKPQNSGKLRAVPHGRDLSRGLLPGPSHGSTRAHLTQASRRATSRLAATSSRPHDNTTAKPTPIPGQPQPPEEPCTQGQGNRDPDIRGNLAACRADGGADPGRTDGLGGALREKGASPAFDRTRKGRLRPGRRTTASSRWAPGSPAPASAWPCCCGPATPARTRSPTIRRCWPRPSGRSRPGPAEDPHPRRRGRRQPRAHRSAALPTRAGSSFSPAGG
jgi:hypothetical protein